MNKLKNVPPHFTMLSNVVDNDTIKNLYDKLVSKFNTTDTSGFVLKTRHNN